MTTCSICFAATNDSRHHNIFVVGSEGIDVCPACNLALVEYVRALRRVAGVAKLAGCKKHVEITRHKKEEGE